VAKKKLTEKEAQEIISSFKRAHVLLEVNMSPCCEYPLVPGIMATDDELKQGVGPRFCSKCDKFCCYL
jgi:hypothetical protein